jgi:hypothetical protein
VDELRDTKVDANSIRNIDVFDGGFVWVVGIVFNDDAHCPVACFLLFENNLVDVCAVREWSVVVQVKVTNFREIHNSVTSSTRVTIHVKA